MSAEDLAAVLQDPRRREVLFSQRRCQKSLIDFVREAWPVLEPSTPFVDGRAIRAICSAMEAVARGDVKRLLVNVPPGFSKSMIVNVFFPAWVWGPLGQRSKRFISASYDKALSTRDLVRCRDLITSEWFQERWAIGLKDDDNNKTAYHNEDTGWRMAASVGSALTGWRADFVLIDDPHSARGAESEAEVHEARRWFAETLPTRLNQPSLSCMVEIMQRLNVRDLSQMALDDGWKALILPMRYEAARKCVLPEIGFEDWRTVEGELLWPERFPEKAVAALERTLSLEGGRYAVAGQLQQLPVPRGGGMFKRANARFVDRAPAGGRWVRGWDLAATEESTGCFTVGLKLGLCAGRLVVADVVRIRAEAHGVEEAIKAAHRQDGHEVSVSLPQDPGQAGKAQKAKLAQLLHGADVHFSTESGDKATRAIPCAAQWEAGNVDVVRAPWNDAFLAELELFGPTTTKGTDQVDAFSRGYAYLLTRPEPTGFGDPGTLVEG